MHVGKLGRCLAALTLVGLAATGCTPDPAPTPTPTPLVSQTPTESPQEMQQRLDYEAAEKAYRTFRAEVSRLAGKGGSREATPTMVGTAGGSYLAEYVGFLKSYKTGGFHEEGSEEITYVRHGGYSEKSLILDTCEDSRHVVTYDKKNKVFGRGEIRTAHLEVRKINNVWKVWTGDGEKVTECD